MSHEYAIYEPHAGTIRRFDTPRGALAYATPTASVVDSGVQRP